MGNRFKPKVHTFKKPAPSPLFGLTPHEAFKEKLKAHSALERFMKGEGDVLEWSRILARLSTGRELAYQVCDEAVVVHIHKIACSVGGAYILWRQDNTWEPFHKGVQREVSGALDLIDQIQDLIGPVKYQLIMSNSIDIEIKTQEELLMPWEEFKAVRRKVMHKHRKKDKLDLGIHLEINLT